MERKSDKKKYDDGIMGSMREVAELSIEKIMTETVISVDPDKDLSHVRKLMIEYAISQVPVVENGRVIGMVTEEDIVKAYGRQGSKTKNLKAREVMSAPPPVVRMDIPIEEIVRMLHEKPALLVSDGEEIKGIITRADIVYWALDI